MKTNNMTQQLQCPPPPSFDPVDDQPEPTLATEPPKHLVALLKKIKPHVVSDLPPPEPVYTLNGAPFATRGNFTALSALSKAGKSGILGAMIASTFPPNEKPDPDTLGFSSSNPNGGAVIMIDTEQSAYHLDKNIKRSASRVGYDPLGKSAPPLPSWFSVYSLMKEQVNIDWLEAILWSERERCGSIHSVIVDGVADFVLNVNDMAESNPVVNKIQQLAGEYDCHIVSVIHINPSAGDTQKTRGNLGSQLDRKAETNLVIKMTDTYRVLYIRTARDCSLPESAGTRFRFDEEQGMFVSASLADSGEAGFVEADILQVMAEQPSTAFLRNELKQTFVETHGVSKRTFDRYIKALVDKRFVNEGGPRTRTTVQISDLGILHLEQTGRIDNPPDEDPTDNPPTSNPRVNLC